MLLTGVEIKRHVDLNPRVFALVPKDLSVFCRLHARNYRGARLPWRAWCGGSVAVDIGRIFCDDYVEVVVAT